MSKANSSITGLNTFRLLLSFFEIEKENMALYKRVDIHASIETFIPALRGCIN
ncbi:MAG: hypothetical protein ACFFDT_07155 [Candidatus Hodarchaeota archaeon]